MYEVNTAVYGESSQWLAPNLSKIYIGNINRGNDAEFLYQRTFSTATNAYQHDHTKGFDITAPRLDTSIAFWGINSKAGFVNEYMISGIKDENASQSAVKLFLFPFSEKKAQYPCITSSLGERSSSKVFHLSQWKYIENNAEFRYEDIRPLEWAPLVNFDYRGFLGVVYITASSSTNYGSADIQDFSLDEYFNNDNNINYPVIIRVALRLYSIDRVNFNAPMPVYNLGLPNYGATPTQFVGTSQLNKFIESSPYIQPMQSSIEADTIKELTIIGLSSPTPSSHWVTEISEESALEAIADDDEIEIFKYAPELEEKIDQSNNYDPAIIGYRDLTRDEILTQVAYLGYPFTGNSEYESQEKFRTFNYNVACPEDVYFPEFDSHLITTGEYKHGSDAEQLPNYKWNWMIDVDSSYDPDYTPIERDPENLDSGDLVSNFNNPYFSNGVRYYAMKMREYNLMMRFLNLAFQPNQEQLTQTFKGKNPIEYIVSVLQYPFDLPSTNVSENLVVGGVTIENVDMWNPAEMGTPVKSQRLGIDSLGPFTYRNRATFNFGELNIPRYFNDFRDFEPYTTVEIQLPFCGTYVVDMKKFINHRIGVKYIIDYPTGAVLALIMRDDLMIDTVSGQIAVSAPLSGVAQGDYQNTIARIGFQKQSTELSIVSDSVNMLTSIGSGNIGGVVGSLTGGLNDMMNLSKSDYELKNTAPKVSSVSTPSPLTAFCLDYQPRLLIYRAKSPEFDKDIYGRLEGFACLEFGKISDFEGYTVFSDVEISNIPATSSEIAKIKSLLMEGVYI